MWTWPGISLTEGDRTGWGTSRFKATILLQRGEGGHHILRRWNVISKAQKRSEKNRKNRVSRMKSMKRPAAMFDRAAGGNVVSNVNSKDNVCKDKCFKEKNRGEESVSSLQTRKVHKTKRSVECFNRF